MINCIANHLLTDIYNPIIISAGSNRKSLITSNSSTNEFNIRKP